MAIKIDDVLQSAQAVTTSSSTFLRSLVTKENKKGPEVNTAYRTAHETSYDQAYRTAYETCGNSSPLGIPEHRGSKVQAVLDRRANVTPKGKQR